MNCAIFLDISGVLYQDGEPIAGAVAALNALQARRLPVRLLTNTSRKPRRQVLSELKRMGFNVAADQLFTAPGAIAQRLKALGLRPYCLIHPDLAEDFARFSQEDPNAVVVTDAGECFDYAHLNRAFELLQAGAPLFAVGLNRYFRQGDRLALDAGPFVRALEFAADTEAQVLGKPAPAFFKLARETLPPETERVVMIGDDWESDVNGALDAGLEAALVATGKYQQGDESRLDSAAAGLFASVVEAIDWVLSGESNA
ncbi:TIGR01458 family HAD-type hydrolase [Motiliproteus sp. SC1-56]|uniref:TIGR01458 family HAD-type hydrolase n=1 Tax=Motiliproteus sp. SC1-56 TaxID=2799565 RepID=UPI00351C8DE6